MDAEFGCTLEISTAHTVNQQNVYSVRHHQLLDTLNVRLAVVDANEVKRFAPQLDGRSLLAQNADTLRGKQSGDGFFGLGDRLMVPRQPNTPYGARRPASAWTTSPCAAGSQER